MTGFVGPLKDLGVRVTPAVWDDPSVDWEQFDASIIRSTWDYTEDRDGFVGWARSVPRLLNPVEIVAWNTDKRYLEGLAATGIPAVPTTWISSSDGIDLPAKGVSVVKPSIGAGSIDAERYDLGDTSYRDLATAHVHRLTDSGRTVMLQPFAHAIDDVGETAVILIDGRFSHAVRKGAMLGKADVVADARYLDEEITRSTATDDQIELAMRAVAAVPIDTGPLLYARVDMVPGSNGSANPHGAGADRAVALHGHDARHRTDVRDSNCRARPSNGRGSGIERGRARAPARRARPQQEKSSPDH